MAASAEWALGLLDLGQGRVHRPDVRVARVFPVLLSAALIVGGIAGFKALLAPYGIPLGLAITALGVWILVTRRREPS